MKHTRMLLGQIIITTPPSNLRSRSPPSNSLLLSTLNILPHTHTEYYCRVNNPGGKRKHPLVSLASLSTYTCPPNWEILDIANSFKIKRNCCSFLPSFNSFAGEKNTREMGRGNILYIPTFHIISCHIMLCFGWSFFAPFFINHPHEPRRQKAACGIVSYSETIKKKQRKGLN